MMNQRIKINNYISGGVNMDRNYRILGIPNKSSKEMIKEAYYTKMKALHPDKIHGTPLEDTATFFTAEITEAYNNLMVQYKEDYVTSTKSNQPSFIEKKIFIESKGFLKYTLSNNINTIINEIYNSEKRTFPDSASQIPWNINPALSQNVKNIMNTHNMKYSMASFWEGNIKYIIINKKENNNWYFSCYEINSKRKNTSSSVYKNYPRNKRNPKQKNQFAVLVKIVIAVVIFGVIFIQFNKQELRNQPQAGNPRDAQTFATVISCDWLNVRRTPSAINDSNIIEAIRANTKVEITEKSNNGWVKIRYDTGKTGYVHGSYLSF